MSDIPIVILLMLNLLLLILGAVMDNIAAMIILGDVLMSVGAQIGLDPIHLGAMIVINFAIGMATPPFGYSLFVGAASLGVFDDRPEPILALPFSKTGLAGTESPAE